MDVAIVTGASSGIGLSIAKKLVELEYKVYGCARDFSQTDFPHECFVQNSCDVTDIPKLTGTIERVIQEERDIRVLVNNAGTGYFGPHETIKPAQLEEMVKTNLLAPLVLSRLLLPTLRETRGAIINIASITALEPSRFGCAYAATKAALHHFSRSLFVEVRKSGVKVVTILPDITKTPFYEKLDFRPADDPSCYLTPTCVADAVASVLSQREGTVITEIVLRPQKLRVEKKRRQ